MEELALPRDAALCTSDLALTDLLLQEPAREIPKAHSRMLLRDDARFDAFELASLPLQRLELGRFE